MADIDTTTNNAFRFPSANNNGVDFGTGIADFATDVDGMWDDGTLGAQPSAGKRNRTYYSSDTDQFFLDNGTSWRALGLTPVIVSGSTTVNYGQMLIGGGAGTVTVPAPKQGAMVAVFNGDGTAMSVTSSIVMSGIGVSTNSFPLGGFGTSVVLIADSGQWLILSGKRDTGWSSNLRVVGDEAFGIATATIASGTSKSTNVTVAHGLGATPTWMSASADNNGGFVVGTVSANSTTLSVYAGTGFGGGTVGSATNVPIHWHAKL